MYSINKFHLDGNPQRAYATVFTAIVFCVLLYQRYFLFKFTYCSSEYRDNIYQKEFLREILYSIVETIIHGKEILDLNNMKEISKLNGITEIFNHERRNLKSSQVKEIYGTTALDLFSQMDNLTYEFWSEKIFNLTNMKKNFSLRVGVENNCKKDKEILKENLSNFFFLFFRISLLINIGWVKVRNYDNKILFSFDYDNSFLSESIIGRFKNLFLLKDSLEKKEDVISIFNKKDNKFHVLNVISILDSISHINNKGSNHDYDDKVEETEEDKIHEKFIDYLFFFNTNDSNPNTNDSRKISIKYLLNNQPLFNKINNIQEVKIRGKNNTDENTTWCELYDYLKLSQKQHEAFIIVTKSYAFIFLILFITYIFYYIKYIYHLFIKKKKRFVSSYKNELKKETVKNIDNLTEDYYITYEDTKY